MISVHDAISAVLSQAREALSLRQVHAAILPLAVEQRQTGELIYFAAERRAELVEKIRNMRMGLGKSPAPPLDALASECRKQVAAGAAFRLAILAQGPHDLIEKLNLAEKKIAQPACNHLRAPNGVYFASGAKAGKTAILFPGQGSQFHRMLEHICLWNARARAWFCSLDEAYEAAGLPAATRLLYPSAAASSPADDGLFGLEQGAQLSLAASLALYELICGLGVQADVLLGHSNGEHAALIAAGAFAFPDLDSACRNLCRGGLLLAKLPRPPEREGVAAISNVDRVRLSELLNDRSEELFVAMDNAPSQLVLAGRARAVQAAIQLTEQTGGIALPLAFERAWHTPLFEDAAVVLRGYYDGLPIAAPKVPVYSCLDGEPFPDDPDRIRARTSRQWVVPVHFHQTILKLHDQGVCLFIEAGPGNKLTGFVDDALRGRPHLAVSASSRTRPDLLQLQLLAAELFVHGCVPPVDVWELLLRMPSGSAGLRPKSPPAARAYSSTAAWKQQAPGATTIVESHRSLLAEIRASELRVLERFQRSMGSLSVLPQPAGGEFLEQESRTSSSAAIFRCRLDLARHPLLAHHSFGRSVSPVLPKRLPLAVVPFTMSLELLAEAAARACPGSVRVITDIRAHHWLALDHGVLNLELETERKPRREGNLVVGGKIFQVIQGERRLAFEGDVHIATAHAAPPRVNALSDRLSGRAPRWAVDDFYARFAFHGPCFQGLDRVLSVTGESIEAEVKVTPLAGVEAGGLHLDPALLDCAGQLAAFWLLEQGERQFGIFPFLAKSYSFYGKRLPVGNRLRCRGSVRRAGEDSTNARFEFFDRDGGLIAAVDGLRQRMIRFPKELAEIMVRPAHEVFLSGEQVVAGAGRGAAINSEDWSLLHSHGAIWARAIAHLVLDDEELGCWRDLQNGNHRVNWLLRRIVVKDAIRRCFAIRNPSLACADIHVQVNNPGTVTALDRSGVVLPVSAALHEANGMFFAVASLEDSPGTGELTSPLSAPANMLAQENCW